MILAIFPFIILVVLFGYSLSLDGAINGITYYVTPNNTKLYEIDVWADAASQIFYSLGPCFGGLISVSSYNKFTNNFTCRLCTVVILPKFVNKTKLGSYLSFDHALPSYLI